MMPRLPWASAWEESAAMARRTCGMASLVGVAFDARRLGRVETLGPKQDFHGSSPRLFDWKSPNIRFISDYNQGIRRYEYGNREAYRNRSVSSGKEGEHGTGSSRPRLLVLQPDARDAGPPILVRAVKEVDARRTAAPPSPAAPPRQPVPADKGTAKKSGVPPSAAR